MFRVLTWHLQDGLIGDGRQGPAYYMEQDYSPVSVQINAEIAPGGSDLKVDILLNDVSILNNPAELPRGANVDELAGNLLEETVLDAGSWVTLEIPEMASAKNVTIHLIMETTSDEE